MKDFILRSFLVFLSLGALGQTIDEMEYFFDDDPGYGMATSVTITSGSSISEVFNAPTGSLSTGFHDLFVRVRETGGVMSISSLSGSFEVGEVVTGASSSATGTVLAAFPSRLEILTTGTFSAAETITGGTSAASATLDSFTQNWSVPESRLVYVDPTGAGIVLVDELEYFFDMDPGYDMGTKFTAFSAATVVNEMENISTSSLSVGFHTLFVRARAVGGVWGVPESRLVFVDETGTGVILVDDIEYFFDSDPGYDMGTKFTAFTAADVINQIENIPTGSLSVGFHTLFIRAKSDGNTWGIPESRLVYVDPSGGGVVQVEELEYFFDSDPGYDMGTKFTAFTAADVVNQIENISTSSLSVGFHTLFVRAKSVGDVWGLPESRLVYVDPTGSGVVQVEELEYFFDSDPGYDMGTKFTAFTAANVVNELENIPTGSLSTGFHTLFVRAKSVGDTWGVPESRLVYVDPSGSGVVQVEELEYFFDSDPGYDMGTKFTAFTAADVVNEMENIPTGSLATGFHTLFVRAKSVGDTWGVPESRLVYVDPSGSGVVQVEELEYFFDSDPGYDMGTKFTAFTAADVVNEMENIPTGSVATGFHTLFVRAKSVGDTWGIPEPRLVYVDPASAGVVQVEEIEYFFDSDPGYGMGTKFTAFTAADVVNQVENVPTGSLSTGFHTLFVRAKSVGDTWGVPESRLVFVDPSGGVNVNVTAIEYFFDQDPGVGMATSVTVTTPGFTVNEMFTILAADVPLGTHTLGVRAQNADGTWGMLETKSITSLQDNVLDFARANNDHVTMNSNIVSADYSSGMTIEFWANSTETISSGELDVFSINEPINGDDVLKMFYRADLNSYSLVSNGQATLSSVGVIDDNEWHHFAITISSSGDVILYQDGVFADQASGYPLPSIIDLMFLGAEVNTSGGVVSAGYFEGQIEDFRVWNEELSASLIQNHLGDQDLTGHASLTSLIAHFTFDQGDAGADNSTVTTLEDFSGNSNDGTLSSGFDLMGSISNWVSSTLGSSGTTNPTVPATQAGDVQVSGIEDTEALITIASPGNGDRRVIAMKQGNSGFPTPTDNTYYSADPVFGNGADLGGGWYVVFNGYGSAETVTNLTATTEYIVAVLEVNGATGFEVYNTTTATGNPATFTTDLPPDVVNPTPVVQAITVSLDATGNVTITPDQVDNGSLDDRTIAANLILSLDIDAFDCTDLGANTVMLTVTDEAGNSASASTTVTVEDNTDPTVVTQDITVMLDASDMASISTTDIDNGSSDNCSFTLSLDVMNFTSADLGDNTVTLTATDPSGNMGMATATVTVELSNQPPILSYIFYVEENTADGTLIGAVVATDPEGDPLTYSILSGNTNDAFAIGSTTGDLTVNSQAALDYETNPVFDLMVQADDGNGGISMVSITVNLIDIVDENPLGVDDLENKITVYPNPAQGTLFVELQGLNARELEVKMFTVSGSQVLTNSRILLKSDGLLEINLEDLDAGIYLLKIMDDDELVIKNILVK